MLNCCIIVSFAQEIKTALGTPEPIQSLLSQAYPTKQIRDQLHDIDLLSLCSTVKTPRCCPLKNRLYTVDLHEKDFQAR